MIVDKTGALERVGGDVDLLRELIDMFVTTEGPKALARLEAAVAGCNPKELQHAAHTLKGSVSIFCGSAGEAYLAAFTLERMGKDGTWEGVDAALARVRAALAELLPALPTLVQ